MTKAYKELSLLIEEKQDLSDFFKRKLDYKKIFSKAMDINSPNVSIIEALAKNLPFDVWFEKEKLLKQFQETMSHNPHHGSIYSWCMTMPEVRKLFSPEEKGWFLHVGLIIRDHQMAYHASLDKDWVRILPDHVLEQEFSRIAEFNAKKFKNEYYQHITTDYLNWFNTEILSHFNDKPRYFFLMGAFSICIGNLRELAELKTLSEIDFMYDDTDKSLILKIDKDLKDCVCFMKNLLGFNDWHKELKDGFVRHCIGPLPQAIYRNANSKELDAFVDMLIPVIEYKKLSENLPEKFEQAPNKIKI